MWDYVTRMLLALQAGQKGQMIANMACLMNAQVSSSLADEVPVLMGSNACSDKLSCGASGAVCLQYLGQWGVWQHKWLPGRWLAKCSQAGQQNGGGLGTCAGGRLLLPPHQGCDQGSSGGKWRVSPTVQNLCQTCHVKRCIAIPTIPLQAGCPANAVLPHVLLCKFYTQISP